MREIFIGIAIGCALVGVFLIVLGSPARSADVSCDTLEIRKLDEIMNMVSGLQADVEIGFGFNKREE